MISHSSDEGVLPQLRATLGRMEMALSLVDDGIVWADGEGRIRWCNASFDALIARPHVEILGARLADLLPLESRGQLVRPGFHGRYDLKKTDRRVVLEISSRQGEIASEGPTAVFVIRDVTERVRAEAAENERARHLRTLVQAGVALTSALHIEQILPEVVKAATAIVSGRSAVLRLLSAEGRLEIRAAHGMSPEYVARADCDVAKSPVAGRALGSGGAIAVEDLALRPDVPLQKQLLEEGIRAMLTVPIATHGRALGVFTVHKAVPYRFTDDEISAVTLLAEQTATALELARLFRESETREALLARQARELEAFTYTVSHDLKAPLRGAEGFARAVLEDYGTRLDSTGRHYLEMIQTSASRMGELIDDLLRYSRLEGSDLKRERVALQPLIEEILEELEPEMQARGITVRTELAVEAVEAEREGLREVVANLVGNAVKFSRETGSAIIVESRQEDDSVILSVADTGIGFDMKYHERIFGIFERLHRQEDYPGTGVGLAIVRKVAERHGGRTWAVSEPGKGSTFYLALPARRGDNA
jgi:signal transduction histidine kinase